MMSRPKQTQISVADVVNIVGDAAIAGGVAEGMLIPLLILDTTSRPEIDEMIRVHAHVGAGDVMTQWATREGRPDQVYLVCQFVRPISLVSILQFDLPHHGILVEGILCSRAVYIQGGKEGDRLGHDPDHARILIEVPDQDFRDTWDVIFLSRAAADIRRGKHVTRREAKRLAAVAVAEVRKIVALRMPQ